MTLRTRPLLRDAAIGAAAGALGTAAIDAIWYARYRRGGDHGDFVGWETSAGLDGWDGAPAPARFGKLVVAHVLHRELPGSRARLVNNVMHWSTGIGWGAVYGVAEERLRSRRLWHGMVFGAAMWLQSYAVLAPAKLYKPIWQYDATTLGKDLTAHVLYGMTTSAARRAMAGR